MSSVELSAFAAGAAIGAGLIIAIGAQNAFVLRQGLRREHTAVVVAICIGCDVALIALGAAGFGTLISRFPALTEIAAWGGAAFLLYYGARSFWSARTPAVLHASGQDVRGLGAVVGATFAVSLLNPHVYLDTIVLLGGVAAQYEPATRLWFALGAATASATWFSALGFGAQLLAPVFDRPAAWRLLDVLVGIVMWAVALRLILGVL
jgi:L-lysine exporter family protein LysE/ArgO